MGKNTIPTGKVAIVVYDGEEIVNTFNGADQYDALSQLNLAIFESCSSVDGYEGLTFTISGIDQRLPLETTCFHYCFGKGRITVSKLLELLQSQDKQ